jgi:hypothetical protein
MSLRTCKDCGLEAHTEEDLEEFAYAGKSRHGNQNSKYGKKNLCKPCAYQRHKNTVITKNYGISREEYDSIMDAAVECEICGSTDDLVYDHDHDTLKFRGILCNRCNRGLGLLGDTYEALQKAAEYLK